MKNQKRLRQIEHLSEAIKQDFGWGLALANALADAGEWDSYPWRALIDTWSKMELDINEHRQVLECFANTELYSKFSYEISDMLYALVKNDGPSYAVELLPQAKQIAAALWKSLDHAISVDVKHGWFNQSVQYPIWGLVNFWLSAASLWRKKQDPPPATLSEDYRRPFIEIIKDASPIGGLGKSILTSQLTFLMAVDEKWTREYLLPLFDLDSADFQAAWDGFVATGRLSPPVAEALKGPFLKAVTRISTDLVNQRHEFVEKYTIMLIFEADDVLGTWIPLLFAHGSHQSQVATQERRLFPRDNRTTPEIFALEMTSRLQEMSDSDKQELWQRWLKDYWQNRVFGRPAPLTSKEAELMLDWLPELNSEFPEAVNLAIQMPPPSLDNMRILACFVTNKTWEDHPEAVAKLLIYLWGCIIPVWHRDTVPKIIAPLLETNISSELKQQLEDIGVQVPVSKVKV